MGRYVTVKNTPSNLLWMAQWDQLSLANLQNSDNVNARLTIKNRPKSGGGFENILEWEKHTTLIENISTANPYTDLPLLTIRNNYVGSEKHNVDIEVFMNESKTHDSKLYTSYHDTTTNEMEISKKIFIADGDIFSKEYEKYLFTYNKTNHVFDYQIYTNSMASVIYNGASLTVNNPIFYFDPTNSDGYFKVKTTQGHCYFQSPIIEQTVADTDSTLFNIKNEIPNSDSKVQIKQQTLISDFNYIFTQSNQSDKITVEMKANMTKGAPTIAVSTTTPIKYEMERNGTGTTTTDLLTFGSQAQFNSGILNNLLIKKAGTITTEIQNQLTSGIKQSTLRLSNNEGYIDENFFYYSANDSTEFNLFASMSRSGTTTTKTPLKYELQRNGSQVVTKNMITITSDFLPPIKDYACARTGNNPLTEDLGVSTTWSYMPTLTPPNIDKTSNFSNCFGTSDGYGFKYVGTRGLRAHVCISITFFSSITTNVQWLLSQMYGIGGGYDVQCSNTLPSTTSPFGACTLNGIVSLSNNDIVRLVLSKTSNSSGTVSFLCNFSIVPIDYTS